MPSGFVDDPEGDVADEEVDDGGFGDDILAADADGIDVLLLNVGQHHSAAVTDDLRRGIDVKGVGCVPESFLRMRSERLLAFIRKGDIALGDGDGVHGTAVQQHIPLPGLGVENPHGDLLSPIYSFLLQIGFHILTEDDISVCFRRSDLAWDDAVIQHPRRLALADMKHLVELFQGYFALPSISAHLAFVIGKELAELHPRLARGVDIEVRINICRRTHIAMAKILLNDLHVHVQRYEKRSAGVAKVMESDIPHPVLF